MNKIDFAVIFSVEKANPNGDPVNENIPRQDFDGYGEMTDVCIKRKIRNYLQDAGKEILMKQNTLGKTDPYYSIAGRVSADKELSGLLKENKVQEFSKAACEKWIDVRTFGQVFAYQGKSDGVSIGIRGPVSIQMARSVQPVEIRKMNIIKGLNTNEEKPKKDASTIGTKYIVEKGAYVFYGSIFPQLASITGFTEHDTELIKQALIHLFDNDASSARPSGSMVVQRVYWWEHNCRSGQYSSGAVHHSLTITPDSEYPYFKVTEKELPGLSPKVFVE